MRCVRLDHLANRQRITYHQAAVGSAWFGDWLACGRTLVAVRPDRVSQGRDGVDVMCVAARQRLHQAKAVLGGEENMTYQVAARIVLEDQRPRLVAAELEVRVETVMDLLRYALEKRLACVYRLPKAA